MEENGVNRLNKRVNEIILECGKMESVSKANLNDIYEEIMKDVTTVINTVQQIILKLITGYKKVAKEKHVFYESFFMEFFKFLSLKKSNEKLHTFLSYFIEFFALGIESGNHQLKWMFAKFLYFLIDNYSFEDHKVLDKSKESTKGRKKGEKDKLQKVVDCCISLLEENKLQSKKFALNMLKKLQGSPDVEKQVKLLLLNVISLDKNKEIRKIALSYINVDSYTANVIAYRIRDVDPSIRNLLLKKYIQARYDFFDLDNNSKSVILYNLVFSHKEYLPYLSELLINPFKFEETSGRPVHEEIPDLDFYRNVLNRIMTFVSSYDMTLIFFFERLYVLIKQTIFKMFENLKFECLEFLIRTIMEDIFSRKHIGIEYQYKPQLFLLLMVVHFLTEKAGVKNENFNIKNEYDENLQKKEADYRRLMTVLDDNTPSMLKVLEVTETIFKLVGDIESKHMILQYVMITNFDDIAKEKLISFLLSYMKNFQVDLPDIRNKVKKINEVLESKAGLGKQTENSLVKKLTDDDFSTAYFMRGGCVEFIPLAFDHDIFGSITKVLYFLIPNDNQKFSVAMKELLDFYNTLGQSDDQIKFIQCQVLMFFMSNCKSFSDSSVRNFTRHINNVFTHIESKFRENVKLYNHLELCALKALGLIMLNSTERLLKMGFLLKLYIQNGDKLVHKTMAYGLLFDFFSSQNPKQLKEKCDSIEAEAEEDDEILSISSIIDVMQKNLFETHNARTLNVLLTGFVKLVYNNREFLKIYNVDLKQIVASLILFWHDQKLRDKEESHTSTIQTLSTFFINTIVISYEESYKIIVGLLVLLETIRHIKQQGHRFSSVVVEFDIYNEEFIKQVVKSFINLTNISLSNNMNKDSKLYGLKAQELLILYFMHKAEESESYLVMLEELLPYCTFWDHSEKKASKIIYSAIEDLLSKPNMTKTVNIKNLKERIREQLGVPAGETLALDDEESEILADIEDRWKMIKTSSLTYFKDLKDTFGALEEMNEDMKSKKKTKTKVEGRSIKKVKTS